MARHKAFTVAEADALIPHLDVLLDQLDEYRRRLLHHCEQLKILEVMWGALVEASGNPDHQEFLRHNRMRAQLSREIEGLVHQEIRGRGLRFPQGGLSHGLVDFPTTFAGRWVYLCWQRGETQVRYWHEIDAGYPGRQELTAEHIICMGKDEEFELPDDSALDF